MHPVRKQRLLLVLFIVLFSSAAIGLVTYALRGNINLFFPPAEVAAWTQVVTTVLASDIALLLY